LRVHARRRRNIRDPNGLILKPYFFRAAFRFAQYAFILIETAALAAALIFPLAGAAVAFLPLTLAQRAR
jgi:hypothetical protein